MPKVALTDGNGWFDDATAVKFDEDSRWNGNNHISRATGSQWDHEALYYTKSGNWVLNHWSQYQGTMETYETIEMAEAARWLITNNRFDAEEFDELPDEVRATVEAELAKAEV